MFGADHAALLEEIVAKINRTQDVVVKLADSQQNLWHEVTRQAKSDAQTMELVAQMAESQKQVNAAMMEALVALAEEVRGGLVLMRGNGNGKKK